MACCVVVRFFFWSRLLCIASTYLLFGANSAFVMGILGLVLCISTMLLFVGGVARSIAGLSSVQKYPVHLLSKRLQNGAPFGAVLFLCAANGIVLFLVHLKIFTTENLVTLAEGFFIANAVIALLAAYKLANRKSIRYAALFFAIVFGCGLLTSHWIVLEIIAGLAWLALR